MCRLTHLASPASCNLQPLFCRSLLVDILTLIVGAIDGRSFYLPQSSVPPAEPGAMWVPPPNSNFSIPSHLYAYPSLSAGESIRKQFTPTMPHNRIYGTPFTLALIFNFSIMTAIITTSFQSSLRTVQISKWP